jgi:mono/diheme cytochrome c family protein
MILAGLVLLPACQQKMAGQPSFKPMEPNPFFQYEQSARPLAAGTVARGQLRTDLHLYRGLRRPGAMSWVWPASAAGIGAQSPWAAFVTVANQPSEYTDTFPFPVTREVMEHGRHRYMIFCVVCHDSLGTGQGKIVERGYSAPPSYHIERLRKAPPGYLFDVVSNGYGSMPSYSEQTPPRDRWAIVAYIRALQLSQRFPEKDLRPEMREEWVRTSSVGQMGGPPE